MKTFLFFLVLMIFVVCIMQKTNNKTEEETERTKMMIIENHLTGEIDTLWFNETFDSFVIDSIDSFDTLRFEK